MTTAYLDTSVVNRVVLRQPGRIADWSAWDAVVSSRLLQVEARRAIDRLRMEGALNSNLVETAISELVRAEARIGVITLDERILRAASAPMPSPVGTLDAIHIASAILYEQVLGAPVVLVTHDRQQGVAAGLLGLQVVGI